MARSEILIDPNSTRQAGTGGEVWKDESQVPRFCNHWVVTIAAALTIPTRMHMHVGHDRHVELAALLPHESELSTVELNDAVREAGRINVVVIQEVAYSANPASDAAEKEGTAFASISGASSQLTDAEVPDMQVADQLRRLADCCTQQR
jgi:hypothetical protein